MYTLDQLRPAIETSWSGETAYPGSGWTPATPARAQCVVTALVVQHYLGEELQKLDTVFQGKPESHYRNILPDGTITDFSRAQYPADQSLHIGTVNLHGFKNAREKMLHEPDTKSRYELLLSRVDAVLKAT